MPPPLGGLYLHVGGALCALYYIVHIVPTRDEAVMLLIWLIVLFCDAQYFVQLCLKWTLIMPKLVYFTNILSNYAWGGLQLCPNYSILPIYGWRIRLCFMLPGDVSSHLKNKIMGDWQVELPAAINTTGCDHYLPPACVICPISHMFMDLCCFLGDR